MAGKSIVVVDDDESMQFLVGHILKQGGYEVHAAPDGIQGMALVRQTNPAVVILDFMLPAGGGAVFHKGLRNSPQKNMPVVILSAAQEELVAKTVDMDGLTYFVKKPCEKTLLMAVVAQAMA